jgi:hypothetical protein
MTEGLTPEQIAEIEARMRDRAFSESGFLGPGESLTARIADDARTLAQRGITHAQVAARLETLVARRARAWALARRQRRMIVDPVQVEPGFSVQSLRFMGYQDCPWAAAGCPSTDSTHEVHNARLGRSLTFSGLMPHLVRDHRFFEGIDRPYRLDPIDAIEVLEISPATSGEPDWQLEAVYPIEAFSNDPRRPLDVQAFGAPRSPAPGVLVWRCAGERVLVETTAACSEGGIVLDDAILELLIVPGRMVFGPLRLQRYLECVGFA